MLAYFQQLQLVCWPLQMRLCNAAPPGEPCALAMRQVQQSSALQMR